MLTLYNTLTRRKEKFVPLKDKKVRLYTCGPTVYDYAHIGNLRTYIFEDVLRRVLQYNNYQVKHIMNITDVGHLTSDGDWGQDKLEKGAERENKTVFEIAQFYTRAFQKDLKRLNILPPHIWPKATRHIKEQIDLIKRLERKGFTYESKEAVYFDTNKFPKYTELAKQKLKEKKVGSRQEVVIDKSKKNPTDFVLWFKRVGKYKNHMMHWSSPWGEGFPGWHIECSAMSMKYLGETFDLHCGGVDHIGIHHTNEIAQSEGATGKRFVRYWLHGEFLKISGERMGKSEGNLITLQDLVAKGFNPLAFRYLVLTAHYRSKLNFTWQSLRQAQKGLKKLSQKVLELKKGLPIRGKHFGGGDDKRQAMITTLYRKKILAKINNDLNMPSALAVTWELLKDHRAADKTKYKLLLDFDRVLGLGLGRSQSKNLIIPQRVKELVKERETLRKKGEWKKADEIRKRVWELGYEVRDTIKGVEIFPVLKS